jgi:steroid delta-isomerase-like uncharacterized protein
MSVEVNKQLARRFFQEVWNEDNRDAIDRYIAPDALGNDADFGAGREAFRRQRSEWRTGFPDLHFEVVDIIAEGDKVLTRWVLTGTHTGSFNGIPATGRAIRVEGMSLDVIHDSMIVQGFDGWDNLGFRQQLGLISE